MIDGHDLVWSGASGHGHCRYAAVEPIAGPGKLAWSSRALANETVKNDDDDRGGRDALCASSSGIALWRKRADRGYALTVLNLDTGARIWDTFGGAPFSLYLGTAALWVTTDFGVMGFAQRLADAPGRTADGKPEVTIFPNRDAAVANGHLRIVPIGNELSPIDLGAGIEVALPTTHRGPGKIAIGPGYAAIAGPLPFGQTEWESAGPYVDVIAARDRVWVAIDDDCMAIDLQGVGRARVRGKLRMADARGAFVDTGRGMQLFDPSGEPGPEFPRCTAGAMSPEHVVVYETYEGPDKLRIRLVVCDRATGARVAELPMGTVAMVAGGTIYSAAGTRVVAWPEGKTIEIGAEIDRLTPVDGGLVVRTPRGDVLLFS